MLPVPRVPRLPLVPDVLRRIHVPRDLEAVTSRGAEADPAEGGMTRDEVERVWREAVEWYRAGVHPAIQLCLRRHGKVMIDRSIGHAHGNGPHDPRDVPKRLATTDTPFCVYSASKAITAFLVHKQVERGLIDLAEPVATYIPGYERHGKGEITVGQVLSHRAGVPNLPPEAFDLDEAQDRAYIRDILVDAKPFAAPGRRLAYHAVSGGFIMAEVVEAATGRPIADVLRDEFLEPLGFRWNTYGVPSDADLDAPGSDYVTGLKLTPPGSTILTRALGVPLERIVEMSGDPRFCRAVIPSANVFTTAGELARFFDVMGHGGELDGVRVIEPATIARALTQQSHLEPDLSLIFPTRFSYGLMLGAQAISLFGLDSQHAFGHLGFTNTLAWADPQRATAVAFVTNGKPILYPDVWRLLAMSQRVTHTTRKVF